MSNSADELRDIFLEVTDGESEELTEEGGEDNRRLNEEDVALDDVGDGLDDAVSGGEFDEADQYQ